MQNSNNKIIIYLCAIYTISLFLILIFFGYTPYPDSQGYIAYAQEAIKYKQFYPVKEDLYKLPFLWNIGAINAVIVTLYLFNSIKPILVVYTLMKGFSFLLTYKITQKHFGNRVAYISCIIYMLYPANYGEGTSVLSEVPFVFFILLAIYSSLKGNNILSGVLFGCADYIRPFAIVFILAVIINNWKNYKSYMKMLSIYIIFMLSIGFANYQSKGEFIYKAKTGWMALSQYHWDNDSEKTTANPQNITEDKNLTYSQKDKIWRDLFFDWIKDNKIEYIKQIPIKIINTYISDNINMCTFLSKEEKQSKYMYESLSLHTLLKRFPHYSIVQWFTLINLFIYYTIMMIFILSVKYIKKLKLQWTIFILGTLFIVLVGHGESRFHIPLMPFCIMAASYYICRHSRKTLTNYTKR